MTSIVYLFGRGTRPFFALAASKRYAMPYATVEHVCFLAISENQHFGVCAIRATVYVSVAVDLV